MERILQASLITAIKTPYLESGMIDYQRFDAMVEQQIKHGVQGLVVAGTTGEGHLMDWDEEITLIGHAVHRFGQELVIIGNTGSNNTKEAIRATEMGFAVGMDAALQINPYYGKTSVAGLQAHFGTLLEIGPAILYNVAGRTNQDLKPEFMESLAEHENFVGIKECSGVERIRNYEAKGIACWSGNDDEAHEARHKAGSHGVISVTSHIAPQSLRKLMDHQDEALNSRLTALMNWLFSEPNPIPLNTALAMLGRALPVFRLPYVPMNIDQRRKGKEILLHLKDLEEIGNVQEMRDSDFRIL